MPIPTPFHPRTSKLCTSLLYRDWAGYYAVLSYDTYVDREYYAFRHAAGAIDVTPLFKYEVRGPDSASFLAATSIRNIKRLKVGRVVYCLWCDDDGKVIDDGTIARLDETHFRVSSTGPDFAWFQRFTRGFDVTIEESTHDIATLSVQGPNARHILHEIAGEDVVNLKFFGVMKARVDGMDVHVSRTGYTGDLGYEIWVPNDNAVALYDAVMAGGKTYGIEAAGLDAMDITRIEAGFVLNGIDYFNANHCLIESRKSTPYELGMGWMVKLKREPFTGRDSLIEEKKHGPKRLLVGLEIDWDEFEAHFAKLGLPPEVTGGGWRTSVPVYDDTSEQIGYATSGAWSPMLKRNLALATLKAKYGVPGTKVKFEVTVEYERKTVTATVVKTPFFDPQRKRS
jgi:aminomethyltransferase